MPAVLNKVLLYSVAWKKWGSMTAQGKKVFPNLETYHAQILSEQDDMIANGR